jgi:hypothetical protein
LLSAAIPRSRFQRAKPPATQSARGIRRPQRFDAGGQKLRSPPLGAVWAMGRALQGRAPKGGFKKARGAAARRLAVAMCWIMRKNEHFAYNKHQIHKFTAPDAAVPEMKFPARILSCFEKAGITASVQVAQLYSTGGIRSFKGIGGKSLGEVQAWILASKEWWPCQGKPMGKGFSCQASPMPGAGGLRGPSPPILDGVYGQGLEPQ